MGRAGSRGLVAGRRRPRSRAARGAGRASPARCTGSSRSATATRCCGPRSSGTTSGPAEECAEIERRIGLERLIELTGQPGADRVHGAEAPLARPARARDVRRIRADPAAEGLRAATAHRRARDRRRRRLGDAPLRRRRPALVGGGVRGARACPMEWLPPAFESTGDRRRGRPGGRRTRGRRSSSPGRALGGARDLGRRLRGAPRLRARPAGARPRLLPRGAGDLARDGRDAVGGRLVRLAPRDLLGAAVRRARRRGRARGSRGRRGSCSRRISRASGRRTPTPTSAAPSAASRSGTTAGALARAVLEGVAYGLRDSLELLRALGASPTVGRVSGGGARSELWLRIVASVLDLPLERTESEAGAAFGAALLAGVREGVFADAAEAVRALRPRCRDRDRPGPVLGRRVRRGIRALRRAVPTANVTPVTGIPASELEERRSRLLEHVRGEGLSGYVLFGQDYIRYFTGFVFLSNERPVVYAESVGGEAIVFVPEFEVERTRAETAFAADRVLPGVPGDRAPDEDPRTDAGRRGHPRRDRRRRRRLSRHPRLPGAAAFAR